MPGLTNEVRSAELLATGARLDVVPSEDGPVIRLPSSAPDPVSSTVRLRISGRPEVAALPVSAGKDGVIRLLPENANFSGQVKAEHHGKALNIGFWTDPQDTVSWKIRAPRVGTFAVRIEAAAPAAGVVLEVDGAGKLACPLPATGSYQEYRTTEAGGMTLSPDEPVTLTLKPVAEGWGAVNVRKVELVPQP